MRKLSLILITFGVVFSAEFLFASHAFAVSARETPCYSQMDGYAEAKNGLQKCVDSLEKAHLDLDKLSSATGAKTGSQYCLSELKEVIVNSNQLRMCRTENRWPG